MKSARNVISFCLVIAMLLCNFSIVASAHDDNNINNSNKVQNNIELIANEYSQAIEELEAHYVERKKDGTFRFTKGLGWLSNELHIDMKILVNLRLNMNEVNRQIRNGKLELDEVNDVGVYPEYVLEANSHPGGINTKQHHWWGYFQFISHQMCREMKLMLQAGTAASIIAALFAPLLVVPAAFLQIQIALIDYYDYGCGVVMRVHHIVIVGPTGFWRQCDYLTSCTVFN